MPSSIPSDSSASQGVGAANDPYDRPAVSSDELLPPIEPPSAGFIIQLFVVPALIVAGVVGVWFLIESLARRGEQDPDQIVAALRSSNQARFQQAKELADMLRLPERYPELKTNRDLAQKLAEYLDELVKEGDSGDASVAMRYFLASALGEFNVDDGALALVNAARSDSDRDVRRKAINGLAVLSGALAKLDPPQAIKTEELPDALVELANDQDELIRSETAFVLGVAAAAPEADSRLTGQLEALADDPYTDARFNAAVGLARIGHPKAAAAVAEMLDPESIASSMAGEKAMNEQVTAEALAAQQALKRNTVVTNALSAIQWLLDNRDVPAGSFVPLAAALEKFIAAAPEMNEPRPVPAELLEAAKRTLKKVQARVGSQ